MFSLQCEDLQSSFVQTTFNKLHLFNYIVCVLLLFKCRPLGKYMAI